MARALDKIDSTDRVEAPRDAVSGLPEPGQPWRYDLLRIPLLRAMLRHRAFQFVLMAVNLFFFMLVILTGLLGTAVGNRNFSIIFVWIVWWALLIMLLIPLTARVWCTTCPIPAVGEWAQRGSFIFRRAGPLLGLKLQWPSALRNIWLQNFAFVGVAMFSAVILTLPAATGWLLAGFILIALGLSFVYQRRVFCRYVCPVGGFIGLYSMVAPLEVRVKDPEVCLGHCGKQCARGSEKGYGCPWMEYPGTLERNAYCGMCTECIKVCPTGNIALNLRPFGADLLAPVRHLDESYKGFIMLAAALVYSTVMLGPWGWIKSYANLGSGDLSHYLLYVTGLLSMTLIVGPALFLLAAGVAKLLAGPSKVSLKELFVGFGYTTVPMGLMGWVAFSFSFVLVSGSYVLPVISDPFGWGWNLFGTAHIPWTPIVPQILPYLQVPTLLAGLVFSILLGDHIAREKFETHAQARRAVIPVAVLLTGVTLLFMWLYMG